MKFILEIKVDEADLRSALLLFLKDGDESAIKELKQDFFAKDLKVDFSRIQDQQTRYFLLSGFTAQVMTMKMEMEQADARDRQPQPGKIISLNK